MDKLVLVCGKCGLPLEKRRSKLFNNHNWILSCPQCSNGVIIDPYYDKANKIFDRLDQDSFRLELKVAICAYEKNDGNLYLEFLVWNESEEAWETEDGRYFIQLKKLKEYLIKEENARRIIIKRMILKL